jgi:hypothetical protein
MIDSPLVLDVPRTSLRKRRDRLERRGALELRENRAVRSPKVVRQHVQTAPMGRSDYHLTCVLGGAELDDLVEHRHGHVETLDRELLLPEIRLVHEPLERVDLGQPLEQRLLLAHPQRLAEFSGLDRLPQPQPLPVRGDVLDLVRDRAAVGLAQMRKRLGECPARDVHAQDPRGNLRHQLERQAERLGIKRRIALRLAPEGIELGSKVSVGAMRLEQRGRRLHGLQQLFVGRGRSSRRRGNRGRRSCGRLG